MFRTSQEKNKRSGWKGQITSQEQLSQQRALIKRGCPTSHTIPYTVPT